MSLHFIRFLAHNKFKYENFSRLSLYTKKDHDQGEEICFDLLQNSQGKRINSKERKKYGERKR